MLYCIVLYCIVLYCIVLYCIVLYCIVLYCIVLYCIDHCSNITSNNGVICCWMELVLMHPDTTIEPDHQFKIFMCCFDILCHVLMNCIADIVLIHRVK